MLTEGPVGQCGSEAFYSGTLGDAVGEIERHGGTWRDVEGP